ncbi:MAG: di-heme oxidoredictase family protein [Bryobacteraceae bacterium]
MTGTLTGEGGLGPMFNLDSCGGCHSQPAFGGSAPQVNPQVAVANKAGALNRIPSFITSDGPVREARLIRNPNGTPDGGVAALFTIKGRTDAPGCNLDQPDFATAVKTNNVSFRIPTPLFGSGLIEAIDDSTVVANMKSSSALKAQKGISGHANRSGNDGSMTRFGWKAQNKSLMIFAAEAYNVEQGVTTDLFMQERDSTPGCHFENTPEDHMDVNAGNIQDAIGDVIKFTFFMRMLAPPARGPLNASINNGANLFNTTGCSLCHTATLQTSPNSTPAFSSKPVNLYSDLLVHNMGSGLADGVTQGAAGPGDFRTAPLWGLGQRLFFLHDGRTSNLVEAIKAHSSSGSEANAVITDYNALSTSQKQDILNFLRSL